jgi:hypothetical protein
MLSLVDCIAFSGLTPDQVDAVACFKHIPPIIAAEWAEAVLDTPRGCREVEAALAAEVSLAHDHHLSRERVWTEALAEFRAAHPG